MSNKIRELAILFKTNILLYILSIIVLTSLLVITGIVSTLYSAAYVRVNYMQQTFNGVRLYTLVDSLYESESYNNHLKSNDSIVRVANFYSALTSSANFKFLSRYNQSVIINNFRGNEQFYRNTKAFINANPNLALRIKCIQINQDLFDFYKIKLATGDGIDWNNINFNSDELPILLGARYKDIYELEDILAGEFLGKKFHFVVKGFIEPNTFIHNQGSPEYYLDQHIVLPYPKLSEDFSCSKETFIKKICLNMINGDLVSSGSQKEILLELQRIGKRTGFQQYDIIGLQQLAYKYAEMISVINENKKHLTYSIIILFTLIAFIQHGIARMVLSRRKNLYKTYRLIGYPCSMKVFKWDLFMPYPVAFVIANMIVYKCFNNINFFAFISTLIVTFIVFQITFISCRKIFSDETIKIM